MTFFPNFPGPLRGGTASAIFQEVVCLVEDRQRQASERALALAHKVLADRGDRKAKDRVRSAVDTDARRGEEAAPGNDVAEPLDRRHPLAYCFLSLSSSFWQTRHSGFRRKASSHSRRAASPSPMWA